LRHRQSVGVTALILVQCSQAVQRQVLRRDG
jgi:hypothetical protein